MGTHKVALTAYIFKIDETQLKTMTNASKEPNIIDKARQCPPHENATGAYSVKWVDMQNVSLIPFQLRATLLTIDCVHSSIAGLVCTGFAAGSCHFLERDFYTKPLRPQDYFLYIGDCEKCFTVEECRQCLANDEACELVFPPIMKEDYPKETQGFGIWNIERFTGCRSNDPPLMCGPNDPQAVPNSGLAVVEFGREGFYEFPAAG
jgi:hypothetical protein